MRFISSNSSFQVSPPCLSHLQWPTFTSFLCLLTISPLPPAPTHALGFSFDHAFHYCAASIDLVSGWSAIDYNTCSSATELRHYHCAKISHVHRHFSTSSTSKHSPGHYPFPLTLHLDIHWKINSDRHRNNIQRHVQLFRKCFCHQEGDKSADLLKRSSWKGFEDVCSEWII